jgi:hypothetical protein
MKRALAALCAFVLTIPLAYALQRFAQVAFFPAEPDPRTVVPTAKIAMYWRLYAALPCAAVAAIAVDAARARAGSRLVDALPWAVVVVGFVCLAQGILVP